MILGDVGVDIFFGKALYVFMLGLLLFFTCLSIGLIQNVGGGGKIVAFLFVLLPTLFGFYVFHLIINEFNTKPTDVFWSGETFYIGVVFAVFGTMIFLGIVWFIGTIIIKALGCIF